MNFFPETDYAHCPHCGEFEGMGLVSENGRCYVQCLCGARGPAVERSQYKKDGALTVDVKAMDSATRAAWNRRAGSNGLPEMHAALADAVGRMVGYKNPGIMDEVERWVGRIAAAQASLQSQDAAHMPALA